MIAPSAGLKTEVQIRDYFGTVFERLGPSVPVWLPRLSLRHRRQHFGAGILAARRRTPERRYVQTRGLAGSQEAATNSARL